MAKVRITKKPKALSGLEVKMQDMKPGLYGTNGNRQFSLPNQIQSSRFSEPHTDVRSTLGPVDREDANLEAEKGETAVINVDGMPAHFKIGGKRHSEGGTPLNLPDNSFIYSDTSKMKIKDLVIQAQFGMVPKKSGYTPAEISKKYDINKFRKVLADKNSEPVERKTAEMMISNYNLKLAKLALIQESMKGFPQGIPLVAMPYIIENEMDASQFLPDQAQEQLEGAEQPDADTGEARYGGNIISQWDTHRYGGMPKAQFGNLGPNSFEKFKYNALNPGEEYQSKKPYQEPKKQLTHKDLDASERQILGIIKELRSKDMEVPENVSTAYNKIQEAKKALGKAPEQKPYKGDMAYYNSDGEKVRGLSGEEQWKSYSGENDPSKSYWDRVKGANLFRRDSGKSWLNKETDIVDPRMGEALEKIIPGYGKESKDVGDYVKTLFTMPQYEVNNLLTGYYENPYTTYLRYNKEPENWAAKAAMKYATDPMIVDAPYNLLAKGVTKGVTKAAPHVAKAAGVVGEFATKYGTKLAEGAAELAMKLYGKITPKILEKIVSGSQKLTQASMHDDNSTPEMFNQSETTTTVPGPYKPSPYEALWTPNQTSSQKPTTGSLLVPATKKEKVPVDTTNYDNMSLEDLEALLKQK